MINKIKLLLLLLFLFNGNKALANDCTSGSIKIEPVYSGHTFSFDSNIASNSNIGQYRIVVSQKITCKANQSASNNAMYGTLKLRLLNSCASANGGGIVVDSNIPGLKWYFPDGIAFHCLSKSIQIGPQKNADSQGNVHWDTNEVDYRIWLRQDNAFDFSNSRTFTVNSIASYAGLESWAGTVPIIGTSFNYTYNNVAKCTLAAPNEINFNKVTTSDVINGNISKDLTLTASCSGRGASLGLKFKFEPQNTDASANPLGVFYATNSTGSLGYKLTKKADSSIIPLNESIQLVGENKNKITSTDNIPLLLTLQKGSGKIATGNVETFLNITMEYM